MSVAFQTTQKERVSASFHRDEGYDSFTNCKENKIKSSIETALEALCSRRSEYYDTSSGSTTPRLLESTDNVRSWDEIFETVEKFSHSTMTLLSWIEEFKEIQDIKFDESRDKRTPVHGWSETAISHVQRVYSDVKLNGKKLLKDFQSEQDVVRTIIKNVKKEYRDVAPGWWGSSRDLSPCPPLAPPPADHESGKMKSSVRVDPPLSSTLIYEDDLKLELSDWRDYVSKDAHRVRLWWKLVCEREKSLSWMNSIQRKLDITATYYPAHSLRKLYEQYLAEVREQDSFREPLRSIADVIGELFPELRYRAKTLVHDSEQAYFQLDANVRSKLVDLEPVPAQNPPHARHVYRPYSPSYRSVESCRSSRGSPARSPSPKSRWSAPKKENLMPLFDPDSSGEHQLSDFSFKQIRDKLALSEAKQDDEESSEAPSTSRKGKKITGDKGEVKTDEEETKMEQGMGDDDDIRIVNPIEIAEKALHLHSWMKINESEAVERFSTKPIGWDPIGLRKFLSKNKLMQDELSAQAKSLEKFERSAISYLQQSAASNQTAKVIDDSNLHWALLMLKQRQSTLSLFCLDVQCLLERRLDVTHLLEKKVSVNNLHHPMDNIWTELAVEIKLDGKVTDQDYNLIKEEVPVEEEEDIKSKISSSSSSSPSSSSSSSSASSSSNE